VEGELPGTVVIADMEAGLEHLSIGTLAHIDLLMVMVQPTAKTMMTADRTYRLALELGIPEVGFIGNRLRQPSDRDQLEAFARDHSSQLLVTIPEDDNVRMADAVNRCILDVAPESATVLAVARLADMLEGQFATRL
jgi:CO dehydrogenase maturation factor